MKVWSLIKTCFSIIGLIADAAFFVTTGLIKLCKGLLALRHAFAKEVRCPSGHHTNSAYGVFVCGHCHGRYEGWIWVCPLCHSATSHIHCDHCGLSIKNPYL